MAKKLLNINNYNELMPELSNFLKVAEEQKNLGKNCDLEQYEQLKKIFNFDESIRNNAQNFVSEEKTDVIDLTVAENINDAEEVPPEDKSEVSLNTDQKISVNNLVIALKDSLQIHKTISNELIAELVNCDDAEVIFNCLANTLNCEEIYYFGENLVNAQSVLIHLYLRYLLIPQILKEYNDNLQQIIDIYSLKHTSALKEELTTQILLQNESESLHQYLNTMKDKFRLEILKEVVFRIGKVELNHLEIIEDLLNNCGDVEILGKIIEVTYNACEQFNSEKIVSKLLIKIIQLLGERVIEFEKPLRHLVNVNKSVWKVKLKKLFEKSFEDSTLLSQSFRY